MFKKDFNFIYSYFSHFEMNFEITLNLLIFYNVLAHSRKAYKNKKNNKKRENLILNQPSV